MVAMHRYRAKFAATRAVPGAWLGVIVLVGGLFFGVTALADGAPTEPRVVASPGPVEPLALASVGWRSLAYSRSNIWASVSSRIVLHEVSGEGLEPEPRTAAHAAGGPLLLLQAENQAASNLERISSWFDPAAGALVQRCRVAYGSSDRRAQCYWYEGPSIWRERRESGGAGEPEASNWLEAGPGAVEVPDWRVSSRIELSRPETIPAAAGLVSPMMLFPLASAAPLERPGDSHDVFVHTDRDFFRVTLTLEGRETTDVEYQATAVDGAVRKVVGPVRALVVTVVPRAAGKAREEFTLLGMSGPLSLLLDPETRVPLAVRGRAPWVGETELQLQSVALSR